jgi:membrane-associated phospholipid phosphatase
MKDFSKSILKVFWPYNFIWHLIAIAITYVSVTTGFDWYFFKIMYNLTLARFFAVSALLIGALLPIILPIYLYVHGRKLNNIKLKIIGLALGQAALIAFIISTVYKIFTGRFQPNILSLTLNNSNNFNFGILKNGIIFGWPSAHTMIAFAMAFTLIFLFSKSRKARYLCIIYALFIGLSTTMSYHWFSEFMAGAIIGTVIGIVIGKNFREKLA